MSTVLFALGILALLLVGMGAATDARRRRLEFRIRLFETLGAAVRRGVSLERALVTLEKEVGVLARGKVYAVRTQVEAGASLAEALRVGVASYVPAHVLDAIGAVEGSDGLADGLAAAARESTRTMAVNHRTLLSFVYPLSLLSGILFTGSVARRAVEVTDALPGGSGAGRLVELATTGSAVLLGVGGLLASAIVLRWIGVYRWIDRFTGFRPGDLLLRLPLVRGTARLAASARFLRVLAVRIRAGEPLDRALEEAAPAGRPFTDGSAEKAARDLRQGASPEEAWAVVEVPPFVRARAPLARGADLADALEGLADDCALRREDRVERRLTLAWPVGLLVAAGMLGLMELGVFRLYEAHREAVGLW